MTPDKLIARYKKGLKELRTVEASVEQGKTHTANQKRFVHIEQLKKPLQEMTAELVKLSWKKLADSDLVDLAQFVHRETYDEGPQAAVKAVEEYLDSK